MTQAARWNPDTDPWVLLAREERARKRADAEAAIAEVIAEFGDEVQSKDVQKNQKRRIKDRAQATGGHWTPAIRQAIVEACATAKSWREVAVMIGYSNAALCRWRARHRDFPKCAPAGGPRVAVRDSLGRAARIGGPTPQQVAVYKSARKKAKTWVELAKHVGVPESTLRTWIRRGYLTPWC